MLERNDPALKLDHESYGTDHHKVVLIGLDREAGVGVIFVAVFNPSLDGSDLFAVLSHADELTEIGFTEESDPGGFSQEAQFLIYGLDSLGPCFGVDVSDGYIF